MRLRLLVISSFRVRGESHAAKIGHDDRILVRKPSGERRPHVAGVAEPVEQDQRGSTAANPSVNDGSIDNDVADDKNAWEWPHGCLTLDASNCQAKSNEKLSVLRLVHETSLQ